MKGLKERDERSAMKEGRLSRQMMDVRREFHWAIGRGKKLFLYASVELCTWRT